MRRQPQELSSGLVGAWTSGETLSGARNLESQRRCLSPETECGGRPQQGWSWALQGLVVGVSRCVQPE